MAVCPKCGGEMGLKQTACPHCGYDFPLSPGTPDRTWLIVVIGVFLVVTWVSGFWRHPVGAAIAMVCGVLFILGLTYRVWRLIRDS